MPVSAVVFAEVSGVVAGRRDTLAQSSAIDVALQLPALSNGV